MGPLDGVVDVVASIPCGAPFALSGDGTAVAAGDAIWSGPSYTRRTPLGDIGRVRRFAFSPDGRRLAAYQKHPEYDHCEVVLMDATTGGLLGELRLKSAGIMKGAGIRVTYPFYEYGDRSIAFSPDGRRLGCALDSASRIEIFDTDTREVTATLETHGFHDAVDSDDNAFKAPDKVIDLAWSPDARVLASVSENGVVVLWDGATGARLREAQLAPPLPPVFRGSILIAPDSLTLALSTTGGVGLWPLEALLGGDTSSGRQCALKRAFSQPWLSFVAGGRAIVGGAMEAFDAPTLTELPKRVDTGALELLQIASSADGRLIAAATAESTVVYETSRLWA